MRTLVTLACAAALGLLAPTAQAASTTLWPGVAHDRTVQFTTHGPVVVHVIRGPRPGGLTTLEPLLSNDSVLGRERLTSMQRRVADGVTAGVNADFSRFDNGRVSGMFMRHGELAHGPNANRSSAGVLTDGTLEVRRVGLRASWSAAAPHPLAPLNEPPTAARASLFTAAYGPATPATPGATAAVLFPFPVVTPGAGLPATVVEVVQGDAPVPIPPGGAVLIGFGGQGAAIAAEAPVGSPVSVLFELVPAWQGLVAAVGGGPELVRTGAQVVGTNEWFTPVQLRPRAPRSAVGQLANGRIILVAVDGRQPGYSTGLTSAELARLMIRLGAVRAMAFDSGGSTTAAYDGTLLNRPSDGRERPVGSALVFHYTGAFLGEPTPQVSPNGDGVVETQTLTYRLARPSTVTAELTRPDGTVAFTESGTRDPGTHPIPFPSAGPADTSDGPAEGRWTVRVEAIDDFARTSSMTRSFVVDGTLGFLRAPARLAVPPGGRSVPITFRLSRPARVAVTVAEASGRVIRGGLAPASDLEAGEQSVTWDGRDGRGRRIAGRFTIRVVATSSVGRSELVTQIVLRKAR